MERRAKVELFEQIRREYEFGVGTVLGVARRLGVHRRMVRQALANAQPSERKRADRERPVVAPLISFIDAILEADRKAPRKQRHTAHRIWQRILTQMPELKVAEVTIRQYVRERKQELGWSTRATCVPQSYEPGQEGQVDWYEAWAELAGEPTLLQVFSMRSMASGAAFHRAYHRGTVGIPGRRKVRRQVPGPLAYSFLHDSTVAADWKAKTRRGSSLAKSTSNHARGKYADGLRPEHLSPLVPRPCAASYLPSYCPPMLKRPVFAIPRDRTRIQA